jgi:uncharacterized DUF497 family protein
VKFEFDNAKNDANLRDHKISLARVADFDFDNAVERIDDRYDYGETRWQALGFIEERLYSLVYTERKKAIRAISLRRANDRERKAYAKAKK